MPSEKEITENDIEKGAAVYRLLALWRLIGDPWAMASTSVRELGGEWIRLPDGKLEPRLPEPLQTRLDELVNELVLMDSIQTALLATRNGTVEEIAAYLKEHGDEAGDDVLTPNARIIAARGLADFVYEARCDAQCTSAA